MLAPRIRTTPLGVLVHPWAGVYRQYNVQRAQGKQFPEGDGQPLGPQMVHVQGRRIVWVNFRHCHKILQTPNS